MWYKMKKAVIKWFGDIKIYKYPPFFMLGHTEYKMKGEDVRNILTIIRPGDILLRRYDHYISGLMIPGYFTHAAIYTDNNKIVHMLGDGINEQDILTFCRCDEIAIIRCSDIDTRHYAIEKADTYYNQNIKYDFDFDFSDSTRFSCTEFIDEIYQHPNFNKKLRKGYIMPDDFLTLDRDVYDIVYQKKQGKFYE